MIAPGFPNTGLPNWYLVCQYQPAGNEIGYPGGYFARNVLKQTSGSPNIGIGGSPNGRITLPTPSSITPDDTDSGVAGRRNEKVGGKAALGTFIAVLSCVL
jgi:hypothetical protein